jgi:hypothetical protein
MLKATAARKFSFFRKTLPGNTGAKFYQVKIKVDN